MILDQNKTDLTIRVTGAACLFLCERGFKPVETEVPICSGWVADVAGVCVPTPTEAIKLKLLKRWNYKRWGKDEEYRKAREEWKRLYNEIPDPLTALVEVKTTRADFLQDRKFSQSPPVNLCFLAVPRDLIRKSEYPLGWGILLCNENGTLGKVDQWPTQTTTTDKDTANVVLSIAMRRDNQTRYRRLREMVRAQRLERKDQKVASNIRNLVEMLRQVVTGKQSIDDAAKYYGPRRMPDYVVKDLKTLCADLNVRR